MKFFSKLPWFGGPPEVEKPIDELSALIKANQALGQQIDEIRRQRKDISTRIAALVAAKNAAAPKGPGDAVLGGATLTAKRG